MKIERTGIAGLVVLTPKRFEDNRGFFCETWNKKLLAQNGIDEDFVQDNHSLSREKGTIRGLHCQIEPRAQAKLVRVGRGCVFDVAVDVRLNSPTYGKWAGFELSAENGKQLFIPRGFLHGFVTRTADTELLYKCSAFYSAESENAVRYDDPILAIDWGIGDAKAMISEKDAEAGSFERFASNFQFEEK